MNFIRPVLLVAVALAGMLVPQVPTQASELVKLGRLIVTGKRAPVAPPADEPKAAAVAARPVVTADAADRSANAPRATDAAAEAREVRDVREPAQAGPAERNGTEPAAPKPGLERGGSVSSAGAERSSEPFFSLKSLLRAI